jgi:diguanylate cyclase (GGDEF)-like protein
MVDDRSRAQNGEAGSLPPPRQMILDAVVVGALVFAASRFGIWSRPAGLLAALWPTNALLLGMMVRYKRLATPLGWFAAIIGYLAADLVTGGQLLRTVVLTAGNLAGVIVGYTLFRRIGGPYRRLQNPLSILYLILIIAASAASAGVVGAIANPIFFRGGSINGWTLWFVTELVNYIAILPVVLALPDFRWPWAERRRRGVPNIALIRTIPVLTLVLSCLLGVLFGGPGAIAFPVPSLLWCAVTFGMSTTAALTLLASTWTLLAISFGYLPVGPDLHSLRTMMSVRMGLALIALAPITVASVMAARNELLLRMQYMAEHDQLTGLLNRRAFTERASAELARLSAGPRPSALLMLDVDYFKKINDNFGHATGDLVLATFARIVGDCLRETNLFGRIGGEEFAILLPDCAPQEALAIADRVRTIFADCVVDLEDGRRASTTVSIGIAFMHQGLSTIERPLLIADRALYRAKAAGRNRVEGMDIPLEERVA